MKSFILVLVLAFSANISSAQSDIITKHNGEVINGKVIKVEEYTIVFSYENEDVQNTIGKYAIEKIVYGKSGRVQGVSDKIEVNSEKDWEKVVIIEDKGYVADLKKENEIRVEISQIGNTGDKKAEKKLKMEAAKLGCPFIFMTSDKMIVESTLNQVGVIQVIKKGIAYKY